METSRYKKCVIIVPCGLIKIPLYIWETPVLNGSLFFMAAGQRGGIMEEGIKKYELAEADYMAGMKYKDLADKYNVSLNTIKSWKQRYGWDRKKVCAQKEKCAYKRKRMQKGSLMQKKLLK